jgi:hypothetical protein
VSTGAGSILALVGECQPADAMAVASPWIPRGWSVASSKTAWGASLLAGPAVLHEDDLVVVGTAVADPWGLPGSPLDRRIVLDRFARYGDQVTQLAAGPFAVADLRRASIIAALNGIVPVFLSRGARVAVGSHAEMVAALAGAAFSYPVPRGSSVSVEGKIANIAWFGVSESLPLMSLPALGAEVEHHIRGAGRSRPVRARLFGDVSGQLHLRWVGSAMVASPSARSWRTPAQAAAALHTMRRNVGELWWRAGLRNVTLFVPAFERPAVDSLTLAMEAS